MKVTGPMMSISASGSFAGVMVASRWKGRPYMRQLVTPSNPRSAAQVAFRAMFGFLSRAWSTNTGMGTGPKASWLTLAEQGNFSPFNAFVRYNQDRWSRYEAPLRDTAEPASAGAAIANPSATAGVKSVLLEWDVANTGAQWGTIIFREPDSDPTGLQTQVIAVVNAYENSTNNQYQDLNLTPGITYHYEFQSFSVAGTKGALSAAVNATPT